jgi:hypothetical protein
MITNSQGQSYSAQCYTTHKPLKLGKYKVYGGNASNPVVNDADVYVSLQHGSTCGLISDPWEEKVVTEIQYPITDGQAPININRFKKMISWLCNQLQEGKKIHVGCIGGHGRTGMVLSALVKEILDEKEATEYVRNNYCKKAVETAVQMTFLQKVFDITPVSPTKDFSVSPTVAYAGSNYGSSVYTPVQKSFKSIEVKEKLMRPVYNGLASPPLRGPENGCKAHSPIKSAISLWSRDDK